MRWAALGVALTALLAPALASAAPRTLSLRSLEPRLQEAELATAAVPGGRTRVRILLPSGYRRDPARRYPVLYLLHGATGSEASYTKAGFGLRRHTARLPLIVVMPDSGTSGGGNNPVDLAGNLRGVDLVLRTGDGRPGGRHGDGPFGKRIDPVEAGAPPARVSFRAIEPRYDVYGWQVRLRRRALEFSRLSDADRSGFALTGSGSAIVRTPAFYRPGGRNRIVSSGRRSLQRADRHGRLRVRLVLGAANRFQQFTPEERSTPSSFRRVTVTIRPARERESNATSKL